MNKLIRNIPEQDYRILASKAALAGQNPEEYIRELIIREAMVRTDDSALDSILMEIGAIDDALDALKKYHSQLTGMNSLQAKTEIKRPFQCLQYLLRIKGNLIECMELLNQTIGAAFKE